MKRINFGTSRVLALVIAGVLSAGQALADKPSWAGGGKGGKGERSEHREKSDDKQRGHQDDHEGSRHENVGHGARPGEHFGDQQRTAAREYYGEQFRSGHCPPGLAKKHNGCMPPGQAKKWAVGRPLPRDVVYYAVPSALVVQFGTPPSGHRYVRVAGDILLIATGTRMIVDAIQDLDRM